MEDTTARRFAETTLRESEERFRLLVESVVDYAIVMLDREGHVVSWNAGAERLHRCRAEDIIGQPFRVFHTSEEQATRHAEDELRHAVANGRHEEEGWRARGDGSRFWANVVVTPLYDEERHLIGFAKVTRDTSPRGPRVGESIRPALV